MKRSLSHSSKSSNGRGHSNKKSKSNDQKQLVAAWGAGASRASFQSSPFTDFESYMVAKNRKLHDQFDAAATSVSNTTGLKQIFDGVSIFVDGFTIPSGQELKAYMMNYGGRFENYFSRRRVTHIICSNLPHSKLKDLRAFSRGLPVVKPSWVLDSVNANKLLDWAPYILDQLASDQPKLSSFFAPKDNLLHNSVDVSESTEHCNEVKKQLFSELKDDEILHSHRCENSFNGKQDHINEGHKIESSHDDDEASTVKEDQSVFDDFHIPHLNASEHPKPRLSSSEDPNFVENYFKSSRLHFIGTWKNRYRKRYPPQFLETKPSFSSGGHSSNTQRLIVHIDMDCFFVSVVTRNSPHLIDKPVAVSHSDNTLGTAEISSANYTARNYGIKAGMFVREAKSLCPNLIIVPYNFKAYEEVSDQFYDILHKHCNKVQAVSCDEAFLDITNLEGSNAEALVSIIRNEIFETTRCSASAGISINMLMARLATKTAKPNGQFLIPVEKVDEFLRTLPVRDLPGVGYVLAQNLHKLDIVTCGDLGAKSLDTLQRELGKKTGEMLWNYSKGVDNRVVGVEKEMKSVGAEVNWGVRFKDLNECHHFLRCLCKEVSLRLQGCGVVGRSFTLKIKKRREGAQEPAKFLGCGECDNMSRSITVPTAIDNADFVYNVAKKLFSFFKIDVQEIRGVGIQVSKLESPEQCVGSSSLKSWLTSFQTEKDGGNSMQGGESSSRATNSDALSVPPICNLDVEVIKSLPPDVFSELNDSYGGKLSDLLVKSNEPSASPSSAFQTTGRLVDDKEGGLSGLEVADSDPDETNEEATSGSLLVDTFTNSKNLYYSLHQLCLHETLSDHQFNIFRDLIIKYIKEIAPFDIEDINASFLLLKRFSSRSKSISQIYQSLVPFLQKYVEDIYGGILKFHP